MNLPSISTALPIGIAFGFILERAGLGDSRVIAAQFTGRNFAVVRLMFGAIVTAMLGVMWLEATGWIRIETIATPPTNLAAQTIGAIIFGGGFAVASLCPGTACVAAASGKREGVVAVIGLFIGTAATAVLWPVVDGVMNTGLREGAVLPSDFGLSNGLVVVIITVVGIAAMAIARRSNARESRIWYHLTKPEWIALSLASCFWLAASQPQQSPSRLAAIANEISTEADHVDPLDLADWIKEAKPGLRIIDVREHVDTGTYVIPGARVVALDSVPFLQVTQNEMLVLYSDGGTHAAQAWVLLRARGVKNVRVLKDGMAAWEDEVMQPLVPNDSQLVDLDTTATRFKRARALSLWFGGHPRLADDAISSPGASINNAASRAATPVRKPASTARRRNTC